MDFRDELQAALGDAYTLERELRGGGMSRVFVAKERALGRDVVVKVLPPEMTGAVSIERFKREIQVAARLHHPHIVPLFTAGEVNGIPFFTMPLVDGESLRVRLAHGELPVSDVVSIMRDIAKALVYAHAHGVIHRDIKPDNVLLSGHAATVTDFGVAKALSESTNPGMQPLTDQGIALGTPAYMAPEQASADPNTDHRADIYALGAVAYEMLTGQPPFAGRSPQQLLAAHVTETPESVERLRPAIPPAIAALVMQCLAKRSADRPQSAGDVLHALEAIATPSGGNVPAHAVPRGRWGVYAVAALVVVAAAGALVAWRVTRTPSLNSRRVVVAPFANMTGDSSLNAIGAMAADWITQGLSQVDAVDAVPAQSVQIGANGGVRQVTGLDALRAVGAEVRAGRVVSGSFYRQGDTLRIQSQIVDVDKGKVEVTLDPIVGRVSAPDQAIEQVRGRVVSALESAGLRGSIGEIGHLPSLAAYREFLAGWSPGASSNLANISHYIAAARIDSNFTLAIYYVGLSYGNAGRFREADSVVQVLTARRARLSTFEQDLLAELEALARQDYPSLVAADQKLLTRDSAVRSFTNMARAYTTVNEPRQCLATLHALPPARVPDVWLSYWDLASDCAHMSGDFRGETELLRELHTRLADRSALLPDEFQALVGLGDLAAVQKRMDNIAAETNPATTNFASTYELVANELYAHGHPAEADAYARKGLEWIAHLGPAGLHRPGMPNQLGRLLMMAGSFDSARTIFTALAVGDPAYAGPRAQLALIAALQGDTAFALTAIRALDSLAKLKYAFGRPRLRQAGIAAGLGRKDEAVRYLQLAISEGLAFNTALWHAEFPYRPLQNYEPFKAFLRPKG